nr:MAG TPA: hypothetical protein [Bacteriophage sp.]
MSPNSTSLKAKLYALELVRARQKGVKWNQFIDFLE